MSTNHPEIPLFDLGEPTFEHDALRAACALGLFYIQDPRIDFSKIESLAERARAFFAWSEERKLELRMERGGRAWRGYFPLGGELTSGRADLKEGLYFGQELDANHPDVRAGTPLHGSNLYPDLPGFGTAVEEHMRSMERSAQTLLGRIAQCLGLEDSAFRTRFTHDPLQLFRIFRYPPFVHRSADVDFGVGAHSDYGLLTLLWQDESGGLQVRPSGSTGTDGWIDAPPLPNTLVCNLGDMMERLSGGRCHSITHRVQATPSDRISMPFFLDPGYHAALAPLLAPTRANLAEQTARWDGESVHDFEGTYGAYLLRKVGRVFPGLRADVLERAKTQPRDDQGPEETS